MGNTIMYIPIADLVPSEFHAHLEFQNDNIENLANSIKQLGILEPLIVRKKDNKYEIIIGNRRYNAAKSIGMDKVPVIVENITDEQAINMIITNNVQRKDLTGKEEAALYDKAISYPNTNVEKLSITLGIPIDRIYSKLKLIKKHKNNSNQIIKKPTEETQVNNNIINNDIINISELEKNEIRRERLEMNENQVMGNIMNNGVDQNVTSEANTEPAFGGRFFPSMEENNMNGVNMQEMNNSLNMHQPEPSPIPGFGETIPTPETTVPTFNNVEPIPSSPVEPSPISEVPPMTSPEPMPNTFAEPSIAVPTPEEAPVPTSIPNISMEAPAINPTINMDIQNEAPAINSTINIDVPNEAPSITPNIGFENSVPSDIPPANPSFDINNIPNLTNQESKDITPVINMIKSITTNMELLGYKINVTENEEATSYKINIEVEK